MSKRRTGSIAFVLFALPAVLACGCGDPDWRKDAGPPFKLGELVADGPASAPKFEVLRPADSARITVKPDDPIDCRVRLTYPGDGYLPVFLTAFLRDAKGTDAGSLPMAPIERDGKSYSLGATLKAPNRQGKYHIVIDATFLDRTPSADGTPVWPPKDSHSTITANEIEVRTR